MKYSEIVEAVIAEHFLSTGNSTPFCPIKAKEIAKKVYEMMGCMFISDEKAAAAYQQAVINGLYAAVATIGQARGFETGFVSGFIGFDMSGNSTRAYEKGLHGEQGAAAWDAGRELAQANKFDINEWR
ncbi:TPA: hypothetical protein I6675_003364 [Vibrio cholerae]|uniref:hypothetical protein n=1 Tax=Vibrio cholerae TaxID=666 RepID=UPI001197AFF9|nr:hypothetical protein [Vibrio cholerae]EGQ9333578.1 hypothetical protein [Vibrio cholerae]MBS3661129.1 hypothetical protein [Vibrio cholerae]MDD9696508.1 hypothetical protein [Vibrio cholerae]MDD9705385.1 hypothetical protein [Vibrio cholerae]MEE3775462.1 hypothetical protein [Vibrio cholerae]